MDETMIGGTITHNNTSTSEFSIIHNTMLHNTGRYLLIILSHYNHFDRLSENPPSISIVPCTKYMF